MAAPTLAYFGSDSQNLSLQLTNNDGVTRAFDIEFNRSRDFASDDSIFRRINEVAGAGPGFVTGGFPSDTEWWVRAINTADGAVSAPILAATQPSYASTSYAGFSIDKAMAVVPTAINNMGTVLQNTIAGYPVTNLLLESPAAVTRFPGGSAGVSFMTSGAPIDTFALLGTMMGDDATMNIVGYRDNFGQALVYDSTGQPFRASPGIGRRPSYHLLHKMPVPSTARFWIIYFTTAAPQMLMRNLVVGLARQSINPSQGWGHGLNDMGAAARSRFGDPDRVLGWRGRTVDFDLSWLKEEEYQAKWADLPTLVGKTQPLLVVPNSKRNIWLQDRIGYGVITDWRGQNIRSSRWSASFAIDSIY
jgi:hypothetical protein